MTPTGNHERSDSNDAKLAEALAECERLREENRQLRGRLELLVPEVAAPPAAASAPAGAVTAKSSPEEKVKFFLSLFRGDGVSRGRGQFLILIYKAAKAPPRHGPQVESRVCWRDLSRQESR